MAEENLTLSTKLTSIIVFYAFFWSYWRQILQNREVRIGYIFVRIFFSKNEYHTNDICVGWRCWNLELFLYYELFLQYILSNAIYMQTTCKKLVRYKRNNRRPSNPYTIFGFQSSGFASVGRSYIVITKGLLYLIRKEISLQCIQCIYCTILFHHARADWTLLFF